MNGFNACLLVGRGEGGGDVMSFPEVTKMALLLEWVGSRTTDICLCLFFNLEFRVLLLLFLASSVQHIFFLFLLLPYSRWLGLTPFSIHLFISSVFLWKQSILFFSCCQRASLLESPRPTSIHLSGDQPVFNWHQQRPKRGEAKPFFTITH